MFGTRRQPLKPKQAVIQLAEMIGREIEEDEAPSEESLEDAVVLAGRGLAPEIVECLLEETRRKQPRAHLVTAYCFMLEHALDTLRLGLRTGMTTPQRIIDALQASVAQAAAAGAIEAPMLLLVSRAFARAGIDPGPKLQGALANAMQAQAEAMPAEIAPVDPSEQFAETIASLGDDPFAIYSEFAVFVAAFPPEQQAKMIEGLTNTGDPAALEAAVGFVLARDAAASEAALRALARPQDGQSIPGSLIERLRCVRAWVPEARRAGIDAALAALEPLAEPYQPAPGAELKTVVATLPGGAGAQLLSILGQRDDAEVLASILLNMDSGVDEAIFQDDVDDDDIESKLLGLEDEAGGIDVPIGFIRRRLAAAVATNLDVGVPPPFRLLWVLEALGIGLIEPEPVSAAALADQLLLGLPAERTGPAAVEAAHKASAGWAREHVTVATWSEPAARVEALFRQLKARKQRVEAMATRVLHERRQVWAKTCAWSAATLKASTKELGEDWIDFALVARDLAGDRPLAGLPIIAAITENTIQAFKER